MWFLFGFITLIAFTVYALHERTNTMLLGENKKLDGNQYWFWQSTNNRTGVTNIKFSIQGPAGYSFSFKRETWVDRFFKRIGVCSEYQVGHDAFDKAVYIVSDDDFLCTQLSSNKKLLAKISEIPATGEGITIKELFCSSGVLAVRYYVKTPVLTEYEVSRLALEIVPLLMEVARELKEIPKSINSRWQDPFVIKAALILAISSGLAISGAVNLMRLVWTTAPPLPLTLDDERLWEDSILLGLSGMIVLIVAAIWLLKRSSRTHLVLIELLLVGTFGSIATSLAGLHSLNMEFDTSPGSEYVVKLISKSITRGSRGGERYWFCLEDWNKEGKSRLVMVTYGFHESVMEGDMIMVFQKPGYLGYRWIKSMSLWSTNRDK